MMGTGAMNVPGHQQPHFVFSGGKTGGHLFPGLAVADVLRKTMPRARITFCGSGTEFDRAHVARAGFDYVLLPAAAPPRSVRAGWRFMTHNVRGLRKATAWLQCNQVTTVIGLGGFSSVPMAWAASRQEIPLILLEQNAVPGRATRWLAPLATTVCLTCHESARLFSPTVKTAVTGNPVRAEFLAARSISKHSSRRRVTVLGGSQGASQLNRAVPGALSRLRDALAGWEVLHQTGASDWQATKTVYDRLQLPACVVPFIQNPAPALAKSDFVVGRAGGTTLAELAVLGVPAILVPYPHAAGDHQTRNAERHAGHGAAISVATPRIADHFDQALAHALKTMLTVPAQRQQMAAAMRQMAAPTAAETVARMIASAQQDFSLRRAA